MLWNGSAVFGGNLISDEKKEAFRKVIEREEQVKKDRLKTNKSKLDYYFVR